MTKKMKEMRRKRTILSRKLREGDYETEKGELREGADKEANDMWKEREEINKDKREREKKIRERET